MWVPKLLLPPVKIRILAQKKAKFGPKYALVSRWLVVVVRRVYLARHLYFMLGHGEDWTAAIKTISGRNPGAYKQHSGLIWAVNSSDVGHSKRLFLYPCKNVLYCLNKSNIEIFILCYLILRGKWLLVKKPLYCVLDGCTAHNIVLVSSIDEGINNWKARSLLLFQQENTIRSGCISKQKGHNFFKGIY